MPGTISFMQQSFPGKPKFTEKDVPDLTGKVVIVTGSNTGLGKEIAQILYAKNAKVYMMSRSEEKAQRAIESIKSSTPSSSGELVFVRLDLADLQSIKATADEFLRHESQLHVLFNNAGVGYPEKGSRTAQGYELQLGVNCLGAFALTKLLTPTLVATARNPASSLPHGSVRVVWVSSSAAEAVVPKNFVEDLPKLEERNSFEQYCVSKLGNYFYATELAARHAGADDGLLVSVPINPGNLDSEFWRTQGALMTCVLQKTLLYPPVYGAYTALFAAFSPQVTPEKSGSFVAPWGQFRKISNDLVAASKSKAEGGTGIAKQFWDWSEAQVQQYL